MSDLHRTIDRQLKRVTDAHGSVDLTRLVEVVSTTYAETDQERRRTEHATRLMAEELFDANQAQTQLLDALTTQNARFEAALDNMTQGLCMFDAELRLVVSNRRFVEMFGLVPDDALPGTPLVDLLHKTIDITTMYDDPSARVDAYLRLAAATQHVNARLDLADGRSVMIGHQPLEAGGFVHTFEDVTARRNADLKIVHMATHDALTDLPNRLLLQNRMEALLSNPDTECAVLCLDLDRFKPVNDTLGHPTGDAVLKAVAERLRSTVRGCDTVARLGGDEFAVLLNGHGGGLDIDGVARRIVEQVGQPYEINGQRVVIGVSIGVACAPRDGRDPHGLIKRADNSLYRAKTGGRACYRLFEPEMDRVAQARRALETDLRLAIARGEFEVHYQPMVNLQPRYISGFEALLRWNSPRRGTVQPGVFIPMAEELDLIVEMGEWVLLEACREAARWPGHFKLAINVSPKQFRSENLLNAVRLALNDSGLAPERLELEITESVLMENNGLTHTVLHQLRELGISIAMDDFGTGYSSLAYLSTFPFDRIKIDRSFVQGLGNRPDAIAIVRAVTGLCRSMGIASTAEGVETSDQLDLLVGENCTEVQGFLFSRPIRADAIPALIEDFASEVES